MKSHGARISKRLKLTSLLSPLPAMTFNCLSSQAACSKELIMHLRENDKKKFCRKRKADRERGWDLLRWRWYSALDWEKQRGLNSSFTHTTLTPWSPVEQILIWPRYKSTQHLQKQAQHPSVWGVCEICKYTTQHFRKSESTVEDNPRTTTLYWLTQSDGPVNLT